MVGGSFRKSSHFVAPSCKLELERFSVQLKIQDGAECGNYICFKTTKHYRCLRLQVVEDERDWKIIPDYGGKN